MTGTTQNGQKHFIFIVVRHLRIAGETLNNHSDDSICWVVMVIMII